MSIVLKMIFPSEVNWPVHWPDRSMRSGVTSGAIMAKARAGHFLQWITCRRMRRDDRGALSWTRTPRRNSRRSCLALLNEARRRSTCWISTRCGIWSRRDFGALVTFVKWLSRFDGRSRWRMSRRMCVPVCGDEAGQGISAASGRAQPRCHIWARQI